MQLGGLVLVAKHDAIQLPLADRPGKVGLQQDGALGVAETQIAAGQQSPALGKVEAVAKAHEGVIVISIGAALGDRVPLLVLSGRRLGVLEVGDEHLVDHGRRDSS